MGFQLWAGCHGPMQAEMARYARKQRCERQNVDKKGTFNLQDKCVWLYNASRLSVGRFVCLV